MDCSADDEWFVASARVEGSGQEERQVQVLRVSYRELQVHVWVQVQVQVNAESKFFLSHIVNSDNQKVPENQGSQNKAESKLIVSHIMNSNNVNGSNNKRRNQVQVKLVFYVILCASIAKSL